MNEHPQHLVDWVLENAFTPGRFAVVLVIVFLAIFMGLLPSPMLSAIGQVTEEHRGITQVLRQICVNTAKTPEQVNQCYLEIRPNP